MLRESALPPCTDCLKGCGRARGPNICPRFRVPLAGRVRELRPIPAPCGTRKRRRLGGPFALFSTQHMEHDGRLSAQHDHEMGECFFFSVVGALAPAVLFLVLATALHRLLAGPSAANFEQPCRCAFLVVPTYHVRRGQAAYHELRAIRAGCAALCETDM